MKEREHLSDETMYRTTKSGYDGPIKLQSNLERMVETLWKWTYQRFYFCLFNNLFYLSAFIFSWLKKDLNLKISWMYNILNPVLVFMGFYFIWIFIKIINICWLCSPQRKSWSQVETMELDYKLPKLFTF